MCFGEGRGEGGRGWRQGIAVVRLCSSSSRARLPLQLDHPTVQFLRSLFPTSFTLGEAYTNVEVHQ